MEIESDYIIREIVARDIKKMLEDKRVSEEKKVLNEQTRREYFKERMP